MGSAVFKGSSDPSKPQSIRFGRGLVIGGLVATFIIFITLFALSYAYPATQKLKNAPPPVEWTQKMEHIGVALVYYAVRNGGSLPPKLSTLFKEGYIKELSQFASSDMSGKVQSADDIDAYPNFIYLLPGGRLTDNPQPVLRCNVPDGRTILASKKGLSWDSPSEVYPVNGSK